jgi:hypothetical protein
MAEKKKKKTKDFIERTPEIIVYITPKQMQVANKYGIIASALREKPMTVKEIHDLYYDEETKKHQFSLKTIYRYLEKMEEVDLVIVAGHRVTEGSRVLEKLYSRTGNIYFLEMDEEYRKYKQKYYDKLVDNLFLAVKEIFNKPDLDLQQFKEIIMPYFKSNHAVVDELMRIIPKNEQLTELYSKIDINSVNSLNANIGMLKTFLDHPEILDKLKKILDS